MTKILAAVDISPTARPVLQTAIVLARMLDAEVEAIHVREDGTTTAEEIARSLGVPFRVIEAKPLEQLIAELDEPDVVLAVLGARRHAGDSRPAGHVAVTVAEGSAKPVVVVPPDATVCKPGEMRKILVPLDGTEATARAARKTVRTFAGSGVEVVALHVFDKDTTPFFLDRPEHDLEAWTREFLARYCAEPGSRLELRTGRTGNHVVRTAEEEGVDMIALAWSQDLSPGRAAIVREALVRTCLPVLLLPVARAGRKAGRPLRVAARGR